MERKCVQVNLREREDFRANMATKMTLRSKTSTGPAIQKVIPEIPNDPEQRRILEAHLVNMGCEGLLDVAQAMGSEGMITELLTVPDNRFFNTIRAHPEKWTIEHWRDTYKFKKGFIKVAERNEEHLEGKFIATADPKDDFSLSDLRDPEARLVIGFLNPIFHPEKPKRIISKWAATFLGAMRKEFTVD